MVSRKFLRPQNILTASRIPLSALALVTYDPRDKELFYMFLFVSVVAATSDILDGKIARIRGEAGSFGYNFDGLCDRSFHIAIMIALSLHKDFSSVVLWLLILRDVAIYALRLQANDWVSQAKRLRVYSVVHGYAFRTWAVLYILEDIWVVSGGGSYSPAFAQFQRSWILIVLALSYWGIWSMLKDSFLALDSNQS